MRTTERLVLRPFRESDLESWAALNADPDVTQYLGPPLGREDSDRTAWAINASYEAQGPRLRNRGGGVVARLRLRRGGAGAGAASGNCGDRHSERP
jgi:RimJ/RimL family protein N-acetyltransferase